ncbi:carboxymuconolactone decarboxylase family protein [Limibacillus sp. MBR-115]|jgi:uncharacterized peroxidase-related enzyme|uniref:carboxymuconolactone decarboxylase family protein n=1 Tax=Limibacillus sp. MBR-115 TaxID=3156465 RepID=UPI0033971A42
MARVKLLQRHEVSPNALKVYDQGLNYGSFANQIAVLAHRPPILNSIFKMMLEIREEEVVPRKYLEVALVAVSKLNLCTYCVSHHTPMLMSEAKLTAEGVENLLDYEDHPELDDAQKVIVEYTIALFRDHHRIRDAMFDRLRQHFDDAQIVELTFRITFGIGLNRLNDVLQIPIEDDVAVLDQKA